MFHNKKQLIDHLYSQLNSFTFDDEVSIDKVLTPHQLYQLLLMVVTILPKTMLQVTTDFESEFDGHRSLIDNVDKKTQQLASLSFNILGQKTIGIERLFEFSFILNSLIEKISDTDDYQSYLDQYEKYLYSCFLTLEEVNNLYPTLDKVYTTIRLRDDIYVIMDNNGELYFKDNLKFTIKLKQ